MAGKIEDTSDGKSVQQLLREKNHLFLGDPSKTNMRDGYNGEMAVDLIVFASPTYREPAILVVIANPDTDSELQRVLKCLQARNHDVFVVKQPVDGSGLFDSAESIVNNTQRLVGGAHSMPNCRCRSY
ncbi:unnamed protein product [Microthlaspi erraticum]|uniref:Uncharacterized protein n=1 Tax=Microthlaspi erraticum TaxID=1685480 RepID=A0A6D2IJM2_9BRAS|nr:unnamed protein product [Microthlaspi erraticum]